MTTRYVSAEKLDKDDFGDPFTKKVGELVYDARTLSGVWATMTKKSFLLNTNGILGTGWGQVYERNEKGHLVKVEG
jgi:hypothetical protein